MSDLCVLYSFEIFKVIANLVYSQFMKQFYKSWLFTMSTLHCYYWLLRLQLNDPFPPPSLLSTLSSLHPPPFPLLPPSIKVLTWYSPPPSHPHLLLKLLHLFISQLENFDFCLDNCYESHLKSLLSISFEL